MTQDFRAACIIGWPAGHSRSPIIHNYWIKQHGIAGEYRKEAVPPEALAAFLAGMPARGYVGANVTIPHKEAALRLSSPDERARVVGAANTLYRDGATLCSTNTDVEGFLGNLDAAAPGWDRGLQDAVVLGAGGSARGVVFGLIERGARRIHLVNRTLERAQALRERFGEAVAPARWEDVPALLGGAALLVNCTSLGMAKQPPLAIDVERLSAGAVVADLVYVPLITPLLAAARARGLKTADGLGMLLHQAVRGFSLWFGVKPTVTPELRALVEADLAHS
ncbi:MAG TPA: shikimate dehydrogenase [Xanthobacteraceae bacterium]|jgi:shikimate dehydrogenase|nr:shikimate dehydrogenase [Xanthobacteraceae bacterium]